MKKKLIAVKNADKKYDKAFMAWWKANHERIDAPNEDGTEEISTEFRAARVAFIDGFKLAMDKLDQRISDLEDPMSAIKRQFNT